MVRVAVAEADEQPTVRIETHRHLFAQVSRTRTQDLTRGDRIQAEATLGTLSCDGEDPSIRREREILDVRLFHVDFTDLPAGPRIPETHGVRADSAFLVGPGRGERGAVRRDGEGLEHLAVRRYRANHPVGVGLDNRESRAVGGHDPGSLWIEEAGPP